MDYVIGVNSAVIYYEKKGKDVCYDWQTNYKNISVKADYFSDTKKFSVLFISGNSKYNFDFDCNTALYKRLSNYLNRAIIRFNEELDEDMPIIAAFSLIEQD